MSSTSGGGGGGTAGEGAVVSSGGAATAIAGAGGTEGVEAGTPNAGRSSAGSGGEMSIGGGGSGGASEPIVPPGLDIDGEDVITSEPPANCPSPEAADEFRVVSYNIKHGEGNDGVVNLQRSADVLETLSPDLVALQEMDQEVSRSNGVAQAKFLGDELCMYSAFGRFFNLGGGQYGIAVLSRFPFADAQNVRLPDGAEPRSSVVVQVQNGEGGTVINFAAVHFYQSQAERLAQAQTLIAEIEDLEDRVIVAGDFNSTPGSAILEAFEQQWFNPDKGEDHFTFSSDNPRTEIDFILFRPQARFDVLELDVIDDPLVSDHRPVLAVVDLVDE